MMVRFEENEYILMAMFQRGSRQETMEGIRSAVPFVGEDEEMPALINGTLEKMERITEEEFLSLDLEPYKEEPVEEE